jgi:hypothetical protein
MNIETSKKVSHSVMWLCSILLLCCAIGLAQDVRYNAMPGTNFAKYHTYKWVNCGGQHPDQITNQEIVMDIDGQLTQKGFTKSATDPVDMFVCYQIAVDQERQWNGFGGFRFGGMGSATSSTISNGTMILDMYDAAAKQQIWQGTAAKTLDPSSNQQKNLKNLANGIAKLMKNFPPPVGK